MLVGSFRHSDKVSYGYDRLWLWAGLDRSARAQLVQACEPYIIVLPSVPGPNFNNKPELYFDLLSPWST